MTYAGSPGSTSGHGNGAPVSDSNRASHPSRRNVNDEATSPLTITRSYMPQQQALMLRRDAVYLS